MGDERQGDGIRLSGQLLGEPPHLIPQHRRLVGWVGGRKEIADGAAKSLGQPVHEVDAGGGRGPFEPRDVRGRDVRPAGEFGLRHAGGETAGPQLAAEPQDDLGVLDSLLFSVRA